MNKLMAWIETTIPPSQRSKWIVGVSLCGLLGVSVLTTSLTSTEKVEKLPPVETEGLLSSQKTRPLGVASISAALKQERERNDRLAQQVKRLELAQKEQKKKMGDTKRQQAQIESLSKTVTNLKKTVSEQSRRLTTGQPQKAVSVEEHKAHAFPDISHAQRDSQFSYGEDNLVGGEQASGTSGESALAPALALKDIRTAALINIIESDEKAGPKHTPIKLPSTSVLSGVLITGIDAPTSMVTRQNPVPVLIRIKREAVLPNYADVKAIKDCFMLAGGYGDLSSERAHFRGEAITCVRKDKSILETEISGYAVGEDGKAGLKGRLVSRNSKVLANAMMAGFAQGLAGAFDVNPVPVISTLANGSTQYQQSFSGEALQGGAVKGASTAMERLADYYMDLADAMHPVIEVGAGRVVDLVVTEGTNL